MHFLILDVSRPFNNHIWLPQTFHRDFINLLSKTLMCITLTGQRGSAPPTQSPVKPDPSVKLSAKKKKKRRLLATESEVCVF